MRLLEPICLSVFKQEIYNLEQVFFFHNLLVFCEVAVTTLSCSFGVTLYKQASCLMQPDIYLDEIYVWLTAYHVVDMCVWNCSAFSSPCWSNQFEETRSLKCLIRFGMFSEITVNYDLASLQKKIFWRAGAFRRKNNSYVTNHMQWHQRVLMPFLSLQLCLEPCAVETSEKTATEELRCSFLSDSLYLKQSTQELSIPQNRVHMLSQNIFPGETKASSWYPGVPRFKRDLVLKQLTFYVILLPCCWWFLI